MNGWIYDTVTRGAERKILGPIRAELLGQLSGDIVELGAGTGQNFTYYSAAARVRAIEPSASMLANARKRADQAAAEIQLIQGDDAVLESIPEQTVDAVVATLVFCSVDDPSRTIQRVKHVLKPGGQFITMEHVREMGAWGRVQSIVTPLWRRIAANCHLNRDIEQTVREAGFSSIDVQERRIPPPAFRLIFGAARR